jgi:hypothetical protein
MDRATDLAFAVAPPNEHRNQLCGVQAVRFGPALVAVDLDARGVDNEVPDSLGLKEPTQPKAIASRFVSRGDRPVFGQAESLLGGLDLGEHSVQVAGPNPSDPRFLPEANVGAQLPDDPAQFKRRDTELKSPARYNSTRES